MGEGTLFAPKHKMILRHRRLFCLSLFVIFSVFLAEALPHGTKAVFFWSLLGLSLLVLPFVFKTRRALIFLLALLLASLSFFSSYQISHKREIAKAMGEESEHPISVTVLSPTAASGDVYTAEGELSAFKDGEPFSLRVKIRAPIKLSVGDVLFGAARFTPCDADSYDATKGFYGKVTFVDCKRVDRLSGPLYLLGEFRTFLAERLRSAVEGEGGELLCALLLGIREGLSESFTRDMTRIGTTHMLSLSGMHLVVLTAGVAALLKCLHIGRRVRTACLMLFALFFMLLTGLSPSVMRAGLMFLFSALPLFLREERDGLSSLAAAVAVICLFEPYAAFDLSLWLSALATGGILLLFDRKEKHKEYAVSLPVRLLRMLTLSLSVTFAATLATLPLTLCIFGTLPLLSPLANLLLSPLVQIALYLSLACTAVGSVPLLSWICSEICNLIFTISSALSSIPRTVVTFQTSWALPLVFICFAILLLYFFFCPRRRFFFRVPVCVSLCCAIAIGGIEGAAHLSHRNELTLSYFADESAECDAILFRYQGERLLTVFSDFSAFSSAEAAAFATVSGEVDAFLLPYYTKGTLAYAKSVLSSYTVGSLYLPVPNSAHEYAIYKEILSHAAQMCVPTVAFDASEPFFFGFLTLSQCAIGSGEGRPSFAFAEFLFGYSRIGYFSANALGFSLSPLSLREDALILGTYGAPVVRRYLREDFIKTGAHVACASPALFPFTDASGVAFASSSVGYLPMCTHIS